MYLDKVCQVNFGFNSSSCTPHHPQNQSETFDLENQTIVSEEGQVQAYVSTLYIYLSLIEEVPPIFFVLLLGPWSNKHGRKPLILFSMIAYLLSVLVHMMVIYNDSWTAEYLLLGSIPIGLSGGFYTFSMAIDK